MHVAVCLAALAIPQTTDWPHYRGPDRTGAVAARSWSPEGRAEPLWRTNVGKGYSCPSIVDGRLVTMGFDEAKGVDRIVCLDADRGTKIWEHEFAATDEPQYHGGGTLTSPALRDGRAYCLSRLGKFHVLDLKSGDVVWARDYGAELKIAKTFHGFSASPVLDGKRIFVQLGGLVAALDASNGDVVWKTENLGDMAYSNFALLDVHGTPALAAVCRASFLVLARDDGRRLYEYPWQLRGNAVHCATPIPLGDDRVFLSTAYGKGCAMLRLGKDGNVEKVWANRRMRNKVTACVQHDGHFYGFDESMLRCVDANGASKWRKRGLGLGALSMAGGRLLVLNADGELIVADADPSGFRELSRKKVLDGGVYWTIPVFWDGRVYVRNSLGDLACLDHRIATLEPTAQAKPIGASTQAPAAATLFLRHAESIGVDAFAVEGKALRLRGTWAVPLRGLAPEPMTWTLMAPDRWQQRLHDGGLEYTFDGTVAWAVEPQGPRLVEGDERFELAQLSPLPQLFAPTLPTGAATTATPARFAERDCWKVVATMATGDLRTFYFDAASGQLRGTEGTRRSTLVYHGSQRLQGLTLPERITRYRAEDGQEHVLAIESAEWIDVGDTFAKPGAILRLLRTPEEIARATKALTERFRASLATYRPLITETPLGDRKVQLVVRDGELWLELPGEPYRACSEAEKDGKIRIDGLPIELVIVATEKADEPTIAIIGPDGMKLPFQRLTK